MEHLKEKLETARPIAPYIAEDTDLKAEMYAIWLDFAKLNDQTMERLQFEGRPNKLPKIAAEKFRKGKTESKAPSVVKNELLWETLKKRTISREGGVIANHLSSRFDFGGLAGSVYHAMSRAKGKSFIRALNPVAESGR
jgi:hypothetical protein